MILPFYLAVEPRHRSPPLKLRVLWPETGFAMISKGACSKLVYNIVESHLILVIITIIPLVGAFNHLEKYESQLG